MEISLNPFKTPFKKVNISVLKYMSAEKSLCFLTTGNNVSVNIEVDPRHPNMLPECYFLGADHGKAAATGVSSVTLLG